MDRHHTLLRKIAQNRLNPQETPFPIFEDKNNTLLLRRSELFEDIRPLYCSPSDFIDEYGGFKSTGDVECPVFEMPKHLETEGALAVEKLKKYMKKRFPERLLQGLSLAKTSELVYTAWRSRTRRREAEWGDPEDLGKISNDPRPEEVKIAPEIPQKAINPKLLITSHFIPILTSRLYYSNRPTLQPTTPFTLFTANSAVWSPSERKTFIELYLQNPKNFARIAAHLPFKSCEQCVEFYYRHKKEYKLKQMVASYRKAMVAQRKLILNTSGSLSSLSSGVTNNTVTSITTTNNSTNNITNNSTNINILQPSITALTTNTPITNSSSLIVDDETNLITRKKTGRPVGRPKNKDKQV